MLSVVCGVFRCLLRPGALFVGDLALLALRPGGLPYRIGSRIASGVTEPTINPWLPLACPSSRARKLKPRLSAFCWISHFRSSIGTRVVIAPWPYRARALLGSLVDRIVSPVTARQILKRRTGEGRQ